MLKTDDTMWCLGFGGDLRGLGGGQLGLSNIQYVSTPTQIGSLNTWKLISAGSYLSYAIKNDGSLWSWGRNSYGQLGLNTITPKSSPTQVGSLTNWKLVSAGSYSAYYITDSGNLLTCGNNNYGQLGLGNTTHRSSPVQISSMNNWFSVSSSDGYHGLAHIGNILALKLI
jgi:alpha-tubulin suppressor-like RCC1 family protein